MRTLSPLVVAPLMLLGCMGPMGDVGDVGGADEGLVEAPSLDLVIDEDGTSMSWVLSNGARDTVMLGCEGDYCGGSEPRFRLEALSADGTWADRAPDYEYDEHRDEHRMLWPHESSTVAHSMVPQPGTYRAVVRVDAPEGSVDVSRELVVVGWSAETLSMAEGLLTRADAADCYFTAPRVFAHVLSRSEPDDMVDLLRHAEDGRRWDALEEMVHRGGFVPELSEEVRAAPLEEVRRLGRHFSRQPANLQAPLRGVIAERLLALLEDMSAPVDTDHLELLGHFGPSWPDYAPDTLVARLERGPEEGEGLAEVMNLFVYGPRDRFYGYEDEILAALDERCLGTAVGDVLGDACHRAKRYYSPDFLGGFGRGFGWSSCGGAIVGPMPGTCAEIDGELESLLEETGSPRVHILEGRASRVAD